MKYPDKTSFKVLDIVEQSDGSATVNLDLTDSFVEWFCEYKNLDKFDNQIFQEWFAQALQDSIDNKWYKCAKCEGLYEDQQCTCEESNA